MQVHKTCQLQNEKNQLKVAAMISAGFHYENCNEADKMDFEKAIETIAVAFSSKWVSDAPQLYQTGSSFLHI